MNEGHVEIFVNALFTSIFCDAQLAIYRVLHRELCEELVSSYCNFNTLIIFRYEKIKERNEPLVEFLKTNEVKVCILIY